VKKNSIIALGLKKKKKNKKLPLTMETHCPIDSKSLAMEAGDGAVSTIWP